MFRPLLIPFAVLAGWIGFAYLLGNPVRTATPSFAAAQDLADMPVWGCMFLAGSVALLVAMFSPKDWMTKGALFVGGFIYSWWGALFAVAAYHDHNASLIAPALYGFLAFVHFIASSPELLDRLRKVGRS